jgi:hypothetical protein
MNALELMERLGGEVLSNKIRATVGGEIVVVARMEGTEWALTDKGQELANEHSNLAVAEAEATKPKRSKKAAAEETSPEAPAAVELGDVAPEL